MALSLITYAPLFGQGPSGGSVPPAPRPGPPELSLPIDDNIYILIAVAVLYGGYIAYRKINAKRTAA